MEPNRNQNGNQAGTIKKIGNETKIEPNQNQARTILEPYKQKWNHTKLEYEQNWNQTGTIKTKLEQD